MDVWIFQTGEPLHGDSGDPRPMRAMNLANALVERNHHVVVWSSAFFHQEKRHRSRRFTAVETGKGVELRLIPSWGYERNIGPGRLLDHAQLGVNLRRALVAQKGAPDAAFVGYPPIEFAAVAAGWLESRRVPFLLDGKDQWPEIFIQRFPEALKPLARVAFFPYAWAGRRAMRRATGLTSMAGGFLEWMRAFSGRSPGQFDGVFPLSPAGDQPSEESLRDAFEWWSERGIVGDVAARFLFVGSFSNAMDFLPIREAASRSDAEDRDWQFVLCGAGTRAAEVESMFAGLENVFLPGWVDRPRILALSRISTAGLAPYRNLPDFKMSVPNKILDYLSLGQPVVSPLMGEVRSLIREFDVGLAYDDSVPASLYECLKKLSGSSDLRRRLSENASAVYKQRFGSHSVYGDLVALLERLVQPGSAGSRPIRDG